MKEKDNCVDSFKIESTRIAKLFDIWFHQTNKAIRAQHLVDKVNKTNEWDIKNWTHTKGRTLCMAIQDYESTLPAVIAEEQYDSFSHEQLQKRLNIERQAGQLLFACIGTLSALDLKIQDVFEESLCQQLAACDHSLKKGALSSLNSFFDYKSPGGCGEIGKRD